MYVFMRGGACTAYCLGPEGNQHYLELGDTFKVTVRCDTGFGQSVAAPNVCPAPNCDACPMHWYRDSRRSPPIAHQESRSCYALALNRLSDTKGPNSISRHLKGQIGGQMRQGERVITSVLRVLGELQQLAGFRSLECQYITSHL
jgi:hypothetical protein